MCRIDLVTAPSEGLIERFFEIQIFPSQGKYVCGLFGERSKKILGWTKVMWFFFFFEFTKLFVQLSLLFRPRKCHQTSFTVGRRWRKLEFTWFLATFLIWKAAVTTFTTGKIWINKGHQLQVGILMISKTSLWYHLRPCVTRFSQACLIYLDWLDWLHL